MEAKDTVMDLHGLNIGEISVANEQAEITGAIMLKEGRRQVVEWLTDNCACFQPDLEKNGEYIIPKWQVKLKEWEVDEKDKA